jgi:hypothetical protein
LEGIDTVRKYLIMFDVDENTMAAFSSIETWGVQGSAESEEATSYFNGHVEEVN